MQLQARVDVGAVPPLRIEHDVVRWLSAVRTASECERAFPDCPRNYCVPSGSVLPTSATCVSGWSAMSAPAVARVVVSAAERVLESNPK